MLLCCCCRCWEVSLVLYPSTAEDSVSQFVRLTLTLTLDQQYPSSSPSISIHNPRGLSDDKLSSVKKCLQLEAQSCLGSPVLYQLIEKAKEILTESNIPHGNCVICLYDFKEGETFIKTSCYHYFHSHCLGRYVSHSETELRQREKELEEDKTRDRADYQELTVVCPVCRETLIYDVHQLLSAPAPQLPELDQAAIGSDFQQKWCELQKLLEKQRCKGGIIDPEVESNRFLIHINEVRILWCIHVCCKPYKYLKTQEKEILSNVIKHHAINQSAFQVAAVNHKMWTNCDFCYFG
uniref:E3 ubiquitin-protein ligase RNF25 n=1 Tax=Amphiprion ocellaris TaxID=80972 RepID=A0A3Q1BI91_AMPOC